MDIQSLPQFLIHALAAAQLRTIERSSNGAHELPVVPNTSITATTAIDILERCPDPYSWTVLQHVEFAQAIRQSTTAAPTIDTDAVARA